MSLAETALQERAESAEPQTGENRLPVPGKYTVESTGAPQQIPWGETIEIEIVVDPEGQPRGQFTLGIEPLGYTEPLDNGDFAVHYIFGKSPARLQFRQTGMDAEYMFGVSMAFSPIPDTGPMPMEDPPVTGVWGAETRPPREEPYPGE